MNMEIRHGNLKDLEEITELEKKCFPVAEAATRESFESRLKVFGEHFWLLTENDRIISAVNGLCTDIPKLQDAMYEDAGMHNPKGEWQMIFGVETLPERQGEGLATHLLKHVIEECRQQGRKGIVLTCKDELIGFYEKVGFVHEGKSASEHGGVPWNDMRLKF